MSTTTRASIGVGSVVVGFRRSDYYIFGELSWTSLQYTKRQQGFECGDASIIPLFTSNYPLRDDTSRQALTKLKMFRNLTSIEMKAITGCQSIPWSLRTRLADGALGSPSREYWWKDDPPLFFLAEEGKRQDNNGQWQNQTSTITLLIKEP